MNKKPNMQSEAMTNIVENPMLIDLRAELRSVGERMQMYEVQLTGSERVVIVVGCDDSRVGVPIEVIDGTSYIYLPVIGGGIPEKEMLDAVLTQLKTLKITPRNKVQILLTQHGSTEEIKLVFAKDAEEACRHITCGLRAVVEQNRDEFQKLRHALTSYLRTQNVADFLRAATLLDQISKSTGVPRRLLLRAVHNNKSSYMQANLRAVLEAVESMSLGVKAILTGYYDHELKRIELTGRFTSHSGNIQLPLEPWQNTFQDPSVITISFGPRAAVVHNGVILPDTIGSEPGKSFNAVASSTTDQLTNALAEAWYAANSATSGDHGQNFVSTNRCIILCDNQAFVETAKKVLGSEEFLTELGEAYQKVGPIILVNLEQADAEEYTPFD